jgi:3-dehydroquinate synthase
MSDLTRITVDGASPYDVVIGDGLGHLLPDMIGSAPRQVAVIHPRALRATGEQVRADLAAAGFEAHAIEVPDAEEAKKVAVA